MRCRCDPGKDVTRQQAHSELVRIVKNDRVVDGQVKRRGGRHGRSQRALTLRGLHPADFLTAADLHRPTSTDALAQGPPRGSTPAAAWAFGQGMRAGARKMLAAALQAEVAAYIDHFAGLRDENGRRLVVRNGTAEPRTVLTSAGAVEVTAPRVNDKRTDADTGERLRFSSAILPPWARKTPQV